MPYARTRGVHAANHGERQPVRDADRNRRLASDAETVTDEALFPSLSDGITLLDIEDERGVPVIQSLVLDHLLVTDGPAFWVDANGYATTTSLARLAPSHRILDRIHVARGFTPYQHYGIICDLPATVNHTLRAAATQTGGERDQTSSPSPAVLVAPAVDAQYRATDTMRGEAAETLLARALARLRAYADGYDVPIVVTRSQRDAFAEPIERIADRHITCERTRFGPRFVGEDFETLVYPVGDGAYYQTTFAYWRHVLTARAEQCGVEPTGHRTEPATSTVGTGVTADGTRTRLNAAPLREAWSHAGGGR
ncbi:hypothetical protein [Halobellus ordinarius]|uniref:hypothetical protein n=1 Tax=Halobellus ordinarius TaxID=3075120 RepID=UPI00288092CB|nr:hypothetical protein [Halobellus sp. ZY16]